MKKREERRRRLMTPVKRAAAFAAKIAVGPQQQETNTANVQKSLTKPAVFAPSVLSTKQINTNFSTMFKSPASVTSRTPFKLGQSGKKSIVEENGRRSVRLPYQSNQHNNTTKNSYSRRY